MGCDYYTYVQTVIEYEDLSGTRIAIDSPLFEEYTRCYSYGSASYDPDFEDPPEDELARAIREYGEPTLYQGGTWLCKEAGKRRILTLCERFEIPFNSVKHVYKRMCGYWR